MADKNAFSEREMQIMAMAWQCFSEQPKVDYDKLSKLCGFTNVRSASNAWSAIKKKLAAQVAGTDGDDNGATTPKAAKTTPKKRTKKAADEDDEEETPAKKTKGRKGKATPKNKAESGDDSGDDAVVKPEAGSDDDGLLN